MILKDLITKAKPDANVEIVIMNTTEDMLKNAEELLNKEIEGLDAKVIQARLHIYVWLKKKVSFSMEM